MSAVLESPTLLADVATVHLARPRYEGANIRTWIGFKHFGYLVEEAVLERFRRSGLGPQTLYHRYGLGLEIVESSLQLPATLQVDEEVTAEVRVAGVEPGRGLRLAVRLAVNRDGGRVTALLGKVRVALVREADPPGAEPVPAALAPLVVPDVAAAAGSGAGRGGPGPDGLPTSFHWSWRVPYYYCHFSDRLQHSGYVRAMEEVVDRFLDDRGLSVATMLRERGWIPVVSRAGVRMLADVHMEETVHVVFTVSDILRDVIYSARMDCYVERAGRRVHAATGTILHGYAISRGERAGQLAELDDATRRALSGGAR